MLNFSLLPSRSFAVSLLVLCSMFGLKAQTIPPPYINYQAILYDVNGPNPNAPYALQSFPAFVNINDELGNLLYREEHYSSTDANGQVTIKIGDGLYLAGPITNFNQINWGTGKYYLVVEFDINGTISATSPEQLVTVPYAFYAGNSGSGISIISDNGDGTLTFTYNNGGTYTTPVLSGLTGPQGPTGPTGPAGVPGPQGPEGPQGASGFLPNGSTAGNTPYWDGTQWVVDGGNLYNNGSNIGVGTTNPDASAITEMNSTTQGFLPPRMTTAQRDAIVNPADGLIIFNTSSGCPNYYSGGMWYEWCGTGVLPIGTITDLNCGAATIGGTLTQGVAALLSVTVPYSGSNGGNFTMQTINSTGVLGLTATYTLNSLGLNNTGDFYFSITGTPTSNGTASFDLNIGGQTCTLELPVNLPPAALTSLNCGSATTTGALLQGTAASGVSTSVPYTGGNGGNNDAQSVSSTGVTGLTANLSADTLATGSGSVTYTISGTPATTGTASFALTLGGQSCSFSIAVSSLAAQYPANSVFCASGPTAIVEVTNPTTGKTWMDRNLGASQVATSSTDANAYGDLYQWGRRSDGHQCRNSATTASPSSTDQPTHGNFIITPISTSSSPWDWRIPQNNNLWQGVNGVNNPCLIGYRLPTDAELNNERLSWNSNNGAGAFASALKWTLGGERDNYTGNIFNAGSYGNYWTSTVSSTYSRSLNFDASNASISTMLRAGGISVRCIKETVATLGALNCGSATTSGNVYSGQATSGVSTTVPYTGGNGGYYVAQSVSSTGVTGLTATLAAGTLANGSGNLTFTITGTASGAGTASFSITVGGQNCSFSVTVSTLLSQYPANAVFCASGPTAIVEVTNPTTGKTWMDRNLGASQVATSSTDANAYGDLYQWGRRSDGHQCRTSPTTTTLSTTDQPAHGNFILCPNVPYNWRSPQNANLWQGVNGVNNPCPAGYRVPTDVELNTERLSWPGNNSLGGFNTILKWTTAGHRTNEIALLDAVGTHGYYWGSSVNTAASSSLFFYNGDATIFYLDRGNGFSIRCIKETVATLGALNCGSATTTGALTAGQVASGVSTSVPYTGGNGGNYDAQTINSTGVTGLTANLSAGTLATGAGSVSYTISGTPSATGTASFAITLGGQSCTFTIAVQSALAGQYPANSVFCASGPTAIVDVTNPTTGKTWMNRNLGASQVATSSTDANSYGDLYQWGRRSDGHQCRTSATTTTLSTTDQPAHGNFILAANTPFDWRNPQNNNLWQGVNGVNNPCPSGYRVPTETEFNNERLSWSVNTSAGAFASPLKLPVAGYRFYSLGSLANVGTFGFYWSATVSSTNVRNLSFNSSNATINTDYRAFGFSVRCIKN